MKAGIIYRGPSLLDGEPIVVIATLSDRNPKTGPALQTYILREDINPLEASKTGADYSICGDCNLRGTPTDDPKLKQAVDRPCYVILGHGPRSYGRRISAGSTRSPTRHMLALRWAVVGTSASGLTAIPAPHRPSSGSSSCRNARATQPTRTSLAGDQTSRCSQSITTTRLGTTGATVVAPSGSSQVSSR
jgi:hypothetical protein